MLVTSQFGPRLVNVLAYGQQKGKKYPTDAELLKKIEERRKKELEKLQPKGQDAPAGEQGSAPGKNPEPKSGEGAEKAPDKPGEKPPQPQQEREQPL